MVATSLVLVLSTPTGATRDVGRFHQLVDLDVDRGHRSRLRRFHQSSVEPRNGIGDRCKRRNIHGEMLRQLLPQKVTSHPFVSKDRSSLRNLLCSLLQKDKPHPAAIVAARRACRGSEQEEQRAQRQRGELDMRRVPIRDLHRRGHRQRSSKGDTSRIVWHELDAQAQFLRLQRAEQESVDEVSAHGGRGERHPRLGRSVAPSIAIQTRLPHRDTEQLERPVERMLKNPGAATTEMWSDALQLTNIQWIRYGFSKFWQIFGIGFWGRNRFTDSSYSNFFLDQRK